VSGTFRLALIAMLATSQIIGWGTTFYVPAVLADDMARDLGIAREAVFLGVTLMVTVGALASPLCGRLMDRVGASTFMPIGSLLIGAGLMGFGVLPTLASALLATTLFGVAMPFALSLAAPTLLAQLSGRDARRNIALMMLFTGLSSSVFWPITSSLAQAFAWRGAILSLAAINLLLALPLNAVIARLVSRAGPSQRRGDWPAPLPPRLTSGDLRRRAQWLMVAAFSLQGLASWGLPLHTIAMFEELGVGSTSAVAIAALNGPAQIAARLAEIALAGRVQPLTTAIIAAAHIPLACVLLLAPLNPVTAALGFTMIFFGANGAMSIVRATLPLALLGSAGYGALMGKLALPQNLMFAAAPSLFAVILRSLGSAGATLVTIALSLAALACVVWLAFSVASERR